MKTLKVKLKKIEELEDAVYPFNIPVGFEWIFESDAENFKVPIVGKRFYPGLIKMGQWSTSEVQEIIDNKTFKTCNSIYEWSIIPYDEE